MIVARPWRPWNIVRYVCPPLFGFFAWDVVIAVLYVRFGQQWVSVDALPMPLIGTALALLVAVRNNNAHARWWEARQLWGGIVNNARTLARQVRLYVPDPAVATTLVNLQVAYAHALRCHLRRQPPWNEIARFISPEVLDRLRGSSNLPEALLREIAGRLAALHRAGALGAIELAAFDGTLAALANMQGGVERIKNTPLSRQYSLFPRIFIHIFCVLLPMALVADLGLETPLGSTLIACVFLLLDQVGADLENPFENTVHDVPLTAITRTIEINLREGLGQTDLPPPLQPKDGVLW